MNRFVAFIVGFLVCVTPLGLGLPATAQGNGCSTQVGILGVNSGCHWTWSDYGASSSSGDGHTWVVTVQCGNGGICAEHVECQEAGQPGFMHDVFMDGTDIGDVCVPEQFVEGPNIEALAIRAFRNLDWPSSALSVQPPGGKTLVNLETIFFTTNNKPTTQMVTLAGRSVTIEATPTSYSWDFGDGASETATSPGHPHPDHDVFHVYATTDPVSASVATTYTGRFRIGDGEWRNIPNTLTVAGAPVELDVLEAKPQLVLR